MEESVVCDPLVVVGAGYVGLVNAVGFAHHGHEVWCVDTNERRVAELLSGDARIAEPGLLDGLNAHRGSRLHFMTDLREALTESGARLVFVAVGTPAREDGAANLTHVHHVVDQVPGSLDVALVMKSTVPPGTGKEILRRAEHQEKRLVYVSCPEFLREGQAMENFRDPDRVVVGGVEDSWEREAVCKLHESIAGAEKILKTDVASAETIKYGSNLHLALRVSYANEMANICEELDADIRQVIDGVGRDQRIGGEFLEAGIGFGGSCFAKDVRALSWTARAHGYRLRLAEALLEVNEDQADRVIRKLQRHLGSLEGRRVALLGLTFKPGTDDLRNGTAFALAHRLRHHGAEIRAYDPNEQARARALGNALERGEGRSLSSEWIAPEELAGCAQDALRGAHACVLVTEWGDFKEIPWDEARKAMAGDLVIDGRNLLDPDHLREAGLTYEGTGRLSAGLWRALRVDEAATTGLTS